MHNFGKKLVDRPPGVNQSQPPVADVNEAKAVLDKAEAVLGAAKEAFDALPPRQQWKLGAVHAELARIEREDAQAARVNAQKTIFAAQEEVRKARNRYSEFFLVNW